METRHTLGLRASAATTASVGPNVAERRFPSSTWKNFAFLVGATFGPTVAAVEALHSSGAVLSTRSKISLIEQSAQANFLLSYFHLTLRTNARSLFTVATDGVVVEAATIFQQSATNLWR